MTVYCVHKTGKVNLRIKRLLKGSSLGHLLKNTLKRCPRYIWIITLYFPSPMGRSWRSHGTKFAMLESKLSTGTSRTKRLHQDKFAFSLFWMSQCIACSPAWRILYHVTASCKGPISSYHSKIPLTEYLYAMITVYYLFSKRKMFHMITCSIPKLSDFYTLSQTKLLKNCHSSRNHSGTYLYSAYVL